MDYASSFVVLMSTVENFYNGYFHLLWLFLCQSHSIRVRIICQNHRTVILISSFHCKVLFTKEKKHNSIILVSNDNKEGYYTLYLSAMCVVVVLIYAIITPHYPYPFLTTVNPQPKATSLQWPLCLCLQDGYCGEVINQYINWLDLKVYTLAYCIIKGLADGSPHNHPGRAPCSTKQLRDIARENRADLTDRGWLIPSIFWRLIHSINDLER